MEWIRWGGSEGREGEVAVKLGRSKKEKKKNFKKVSELWVISELSRNYGLV